MMKKYKVYISAFVEESYDIEAESWQAAEAEAMKRWDETKLKDAKIYDLDTDTFDN